MKCTMRPAPACLAHAAPTACKAAPRAAFGPKLPALQQHRGRQQIVMQAAATDAAAFPRWDFMWQQLQRANLESVLPEDAQAMLEDGKATLVDVRFTEAYEKAHPKGSVNAPMFQKIDLSEPTMFRVLKTAAMMFNGVTPTEYNPKFLDLIKEATKDGKAVILACEAGGSMQSTANFATGKTSRSLKACWKVIDSKLVPADKVYHLEGGVYRWFRSGQEMVGEYDASNVGRTPSAADSN